MVQNRCCYVLYELWYQTGYRIYGKGSGRWNADRCHLCNSRDLAGNAKKVGDYFAAKLEKLPHVKEVRHQGLLVGVEFDDTIGGVDVKHGCLDRHLLITAIGAHIIRMIPPLIVTEEECDKAVAIIEDTIKSLEK